MAAYLKAHPSVRVMLVEKTDRLYRNLKDWVTVDELDVEMHFPKEGVVLSRESRSSEKFMHGIKVLMAKNYIDNLSEEARKGMQEKAEQGIWPTKCPLGYRNVTGADGKKVIATDPALAPLIAKLFEWYARGDIIAEGSRAQGARGRPCLSQERRQGAGEHSPHHSAQPALHRLVRMERQADPGPTRRADPGRAMGARSGSDRRSLLEQHETRPARFRLLGFNVVQTVRLRGGR
jgi:Resolvase, N terminal domain